jgi:hypothetical protein
MSAVCDTPMQYKALVKTRASGRYANLSVFYREEGKTTKAVRRKLLLFGDRLSSQQPY